MDGMRTVEVIFGILAGVAVVNIIFFAPQSPGVIQQTFQGTSNLFGTLTRQGVGGVAY